MSKCKVYNLKNHKFKDQLSRIDTWDNEASSWINNQTGGARATLWSGKHGKSTFFKAPVGQDRPCPANGTTTSTRSSPAEPAGAQARFGRPGGAERAAGSPPEWRVRGR